MRPNFVTQQVQRLLPKVGGQLIVEPNYQCSGCILFDNGVRSFYKESSLDVNAQGAVKVAIDKGYTNFFLQKFGFKIPEYTTFVHQDLYKKSSDKNEINTVNAFTTKIGFPLIIKPNDGTKGQHVYKIYDTDSYYQYAQHLFEDSDIMLVQKFVIGNDYRILVFQNKVYCAYQRLALTIVGNGKDNIRLLLENKATALKEKTKRSAFSINDKRIQSNLRHSNLSYDDIPSQGVVISLLDSANLSLGGAAIDCTDSISPAYKNLALMIAQKMGLQWCGIDIIANSICGDVEDYWILELNSAPGLSHFARLGVKAAQLVDDLYLDMLFFLKNRTN